jgi:type II secretory pathway pseudopilin PulG
VRRRLANEGGFGVVELLIAMTVMVIAIMALVAGLQSGMVALRRAADTSTAAAVADKQMERYRALPNCAIYLDAIPATTPYTSDAAYPGVTQTNVTTPAPLVGSSPCTVIPHVELRSAQQTLTGADNRSYNVDTYIVKSTVAGDPAVKKVTLVVRNADNTKTLTRETSTFTPPTGCNNDATKGQPVSVGC